MPDKRSVSLNINKFNNIYTFKTTKGLEYYKFTKKNLVYDFLLKLLQFYYPSIQFFKLYYIVSTVPLKIFQTIYFNPLVKRSTATSRKLSAERPSHRPSELPSSTIRANSSKL